jgi:hypothetical protein
VRELTDAQIEGLKESARGYVENFKSFNRELAVQSEIISVEEQA